MRRKGLVALGLAIGLVLAGSFSSFAGGPVQGEGRRWRYQKDDGTYAVNEWISFGETEMGTELWKYYDANGYELKGEWLEYNGKSYYFDSVVASMKRNEFIVKDKNGNWKEMSWWMTNDEDNEWFKSRDDMMLNKYNETVAIYCVGEDGAMLKNQWFHNYRYSYGYLGNMPCTVTGTYWFYLGEDGNMLRNTTTPDGYIVDELGRWIVDGVVQRTE